MANNEEYKYVYCPLCDTMTVVCPECGNSTCSGGCGCEDTWKFYENTETPEKPDDWEEQMNEYRNWFR